MKLGLPLRRQALSRAYYKQCKAYAFHQRSHRSAPFWRVLQRGSRRMEIITVEASSGFKVELKTSRRVAGVKEARTLSACAGSRTPCSESHSSDRLYNR